MVSKACVDEPWTSASIRSHPISYKKERSACCKREGERPASDRFGGSAPRERPARRAARRLRHRCGDCGHHEAAETRGDHRPLKAIAFDQPESGNQHADHRPRAVAEVKHREDASAALGAEAQHRGAHHGKRHSEQDRLRQNQRGGEQPLQHERCGRSLARGEQRVVRERRHRIEQRVEDERRDAEQRLDHRIRDERRQARVH